LDEGVGRSGVKGMTGILDDIKEVEDGSKRTDMLYQKYTGMSKKRTPLSS
jgi:hypothetical protein